MIKINLTESEAFKVVGCLKLCSSFDGGDEKLDRIVGRITKAHIDMLKELENE